MRPDKSDEKKVWVVFEATVEEPDRRYNKGEIVQMDAARAKALGPRVRAAKKEEIEKVTKEKKGDG